jgi:N-hydroxyarylamine O-acetyltransferase
VFTSARLDAYLERIGLDSPPPRTPEGLRLVHRAHIDSIPYENLDIQLGRPIRLEADALFEKLVVRRRGGFCYEQNHVLGLALEAMGFTVRRVLGGVARATEGDGNWFNHLPLIVAFPRGEYLADTGLGVGFRDPLPLREGSHRVGPFNFGLWKVEAELWRCSMDPRVQDLTFDFTTPTRRIGEFADKCRELSTSPESPFVKVLTVQQPRSKDVLTLRARTVTVYDPALPDGKRVEVLRDLRAFTAVLVDDFGLGVSAAEAHVLWEQAGEQHRRRRPEQDGQAELAEEPEEACTS